MIKKKENGITLVALVVTIVILLILAGVSINLVLGENGIIRKAKEATNKYVQAKENEEKELQELDDWLGKELEMLSPPAKVAEGTEASANGTINGKEPTAMNPIIPQGYIPIKTDTTWGNGTSAPTVENVNKGLVIKDASGNEWVWVPVANPSSLYEQAKSPIALTKAPNAKVDKYTKSEILPGKTRVKPNDPAPSSESYREPDIIVGSNSQPNFDGKQENRTQVGFTTLENMAETLVKDYNEMIASLEKYHGFYIGRYEVSANGEKKGGTVGEQNWYTAYKQAKNIIPAAATGKVETRMIWGIQWDATCKWLESTGININDSSAYGHYFGSKLLAGGTGSNENYKVNNIYDIAGNCSEWTQEACPNNYRATRGGDCVFAGDRAPVSSRQAENPDYYDKVSSRSVLYVK